MNEQISACGGNDRVLCQCGAACRHHKRRGSKLDSVLTRAPDSYRASLGEAHEEADIKCPLAPPTDCWIVHEQQAGRLDTQLVMAGDVSGLEITSSRSARSSSLLYSRTGTLREK